MTHEENAKRFFAVDPALEPDKMSIMHVHLETLKLGAPMKFDLSGFEKLVFTSMPWSPASHMQSQSRIMRTLPKQKKPKIVRWNRYYVRHDMVGLTDLPSSFKFRTKREAIKYWSRSPIILQGAKQCAATSPFAHYFNKGTATGRLNKSNLATPTIFDNIWDDFKRERLTAIAAKTDVDRNLDHAIDDAINDAIDTIALDQVSRKEEFIVECLKQRPTTLEGFEVNLDFKNMRIEDPDA